MSFRFSTIVFGLHFRLQMRTRILLTNFSDVLIYLRFYDLSITKRFINSLSLYEVFKVQSALHTVFQCFVQWRQRDSNSRPPACKAGALPTELCPLTGNYAIVGTCSDFLCQLRVFTLWA